ncbi:TRAP transporter small permease [Petroclostridium sp. X23]|uniref:TRAP transporter small permease n=1 Tax=Petroclostridium sp. X23 TaxID=3045146 RepID=UPI0024AE5367|nr:TRAP transporter small permease [Petroclostridium sp. X23]WHH57979.1 TRAP transporter small permease [Petroclostridium sp. X23]
MKKLLKVLGNLDLLISGASLSIIVITTIGGVFMRKVVGKPFAWLEEIQLLFFVWCVLFGGSVAFRTGNHVGIDLVAERLRPKARKVLDIFIYIITVAVIIYILKGSAELTMQVTKKVTPYLKIPYTVIDIAVPIGCLFMIVQYTVLFVKNIFGKNQGEVGE